MSIREPGGPSVLLAAASSPTSPPATSPPSSPSVAKAAAAGSGIVATGADASAATGASAAESAESEAARASAAAPSTASFAAFREVPRTGVIFVTTEATRRGFSPSSTDWCNLGQGMPEAEELPGAPPRILELPIRPGDQEYAPVAGLWELREAIAGLYNQLFRRGMPSQYSAENVAISGGGRTALTRVAAAMGHINLGHFLPDYTAYEELRRRAREISSSIW